MTRMEGHKGRCRSNSNSPCNKVIAARYATPTTTAAADHVNVKQGSASAAKSGRRSQEHAVNHSNNQPPFPFDPWVSLYPNLLPSLMRIHREKVA